MVDLGCEVDDDGWVTTDATGRTSVPGVWAAGNVVDPRAQVITAAGAGSAAAIALNADLVDDDVRDAVHAVISPDRHPNTRGATMTTPDRAPNPRAAAAGPPTKHQLALMIWLAVFPTLTVLNLALGDWLGTLSPVLRTFVLATIAVPDRHLRADAATAQAPRPDPGPNTGRRSEMTTNAPAGAPLRAPMAATRKATLAAGVLYVVTFISIPALILIWPVLTDPNYVISAGADNRILLGCLLDVVTALAGIGTAVALFPVLRGHNETLALGFVTARVFEAGVILVGVVRACWPW